MPKKKSPSALIDDELRGLCKYWSIPMQEPQSKPKEKPDQALARQEKLRASIKQAETAYYSELKGVYEDMTSWFYSKPLTPR
mmetsp:Transcript_51499/g.133800  ORF Transcript_51499/g.133800 Transcript_51499/m.133800 type:complete len:82 (+) Transcript_51499:141-386(+)